MNTLHEIFAHPQAVRLLLRKLHVTGRLAPLIHETLVDQVVREQARQAGLAISPEELQKAADSFRGRHGLTSAADTNAWLTERGLSVDDFEIGLEEDLLAAKVRSHVTADQVDNHWHARQAEYQRVRLALVIVGREELARELATQVREDGRELEDVARENGLRLQRGERCHNQLNSPLVEALASAEVGQLVGPVGTASGFALAVVEGRPAAELDKTTRKLIQNELFESWLAERLRDATLATAETPG
jgi:hypothetical protein